MKRAESAGAHVAAALLAAGSWCAQPSKARADDPASGTEQRIYGGELAEPCQWPTVVWLDGCTGTLVHPRVVVFAAHCSFPDRVVFGEQAGLPARAIDVESCAANPEYGVAAVGKDQALCVLSQAVDDVPLVPIAMGCEAEAILPGTPATLVGFGSSEQEQAGTKRHVETEVFSVTDGEAFIGGSGKDTCDGDSGGPAFVDLGDGQWRVFGITSYGEDCGQGGYYSMMHTEMAWLEQAVVDWNIDLTPCHDSDGTWNPGEDCRAFATEPGTAHDQWQHGCAGPRSGYPDSCGEAFDAGDDQQPPAIRWVSPEDQTVFGADRGQIAFSAEVEDEGWGVGRVEISIDGSTFDVRYAQPYVWQTTVEVGLHSAAIRASDLAGNESTRSIEFFIEPEPEDGCACRATTPRAGGWAWLGLVIVGCRRFASSRRRCSRRRPRKSPDRSR